jgi:hypothetical protein
MRKWLLSFLVLVIVIVAAAVGAVYYIMPQTSLDLAYEKVSLSQRALDMAKRVSPELKLSERDVVNLAMKSLAEHPQVGEDIVITGARFNLSGNVLVADLNAIWKDRIAVGLKMTYRLSWVSPNLIATVEEAKLRGIALPISAFSNRVIPIEQEIPKVLKIKDIVWENDGVTVVFRKPTLKDLRELLG